MIFRTRFAPSPTGPLHLGHAYSALLAFDLAQAASGALLLRIEDIDQSRARANWEAQIYDDLEWLGLRWEMPVMRQSNRLPAYDAALDALWDRGLLYSCTCTRADIAAAASAPQEGAPLLGPDGIIYPGTCRPTNPISGPRPRDTPLRLDMTRACKMIGWPLTFAEEGDGNPKTITVTQNEMISGVGDIVLARRDMGTSYHLSVVIDDAEQRISHVVRGRDLIEATPVHVVLQHLLGLFQPTYHHHRLIRDAAGKRLAKRDDARAIALFRHKGCSAQDIRAMVGL
ncbi:tRNA glutamyl-Q(34) synthetase GluQRS [uncultured Sulfitobacter sp.]|uniref:tRNA glutamyl-Q(34) synthetase GluQRS n=1 Tax=uncultured Sulfitobacter sp. TaxID=191468 RepID=UPI00260D61AA|nr:tRNA glutamyl-Q(34) synthetase GluQRS [uncultured Sulfitobacter sp.]